MKRYSLICLLALTTACSHPLEIIGEGNIISSSGNRDCSLEQFQSGDPSCTQNLVTGAYRETYYAEPEPDWHFFRWLNYCVKADTNACRFEVPEHVTEQARGKSVPPLIAEFSRGTVFNWKLDTGVIRGADSFSLEVNGITVVATAYTAVWNGLHYELYGPFPTSKNPYWATLDGFYIHPVYEALMLEAGPIGGIPLMHDESAFYSGGSNGFDNYDFHPVEGGGELIQSNFVVFAFSEPVDLGAILISTGGNYDSDFWLASHLNAPDLSQDLAGALEQFSLSLHKKGSGQGGFHAQGLANQHSNFRYLIMGASLNPSTGVLPEISNPDSSGDMFRVRSLTVR